MGSPAIFKARRTKLLTSAGLELSSNAAIDNDGWRNYITNGHAEVSTVGWATYADAAGTAPVDGTGGTANITWTRTTTTPLRGVGSFLLTKDAVNRQGQGSSYDFAIDAADQAKMLQIDFDYEVISGTFATGDVTIWVYDVANAIVIQPSAFQLENAVGKAQARLTFQTSPSSQQYRLIYHISTTSASAYSIEFDNIRLGPQVVPLGAPVTDDIQYIPTIVGAGTVTDNVARWRRVGNTLEVSGYFVAGTPTAVEMTVSLPGVTAGGPLGLLQAVGIMYNDVTASPANKAFSVLITSGQNALRFSFFRADVGISALAPQTGSTLVISGNRYAWFATIPIAGWSSSTIVSSSADTRVMAFRASGGNPASAGSGTPIIWPTVAYDTHAAYNSTTGRLTAPSPGFYRVHGCVSSPTAGVGLSVYVDGVNTVNAGFTDSNGEAVFTATVQVNAGQLIDLRPNATLDVDAASVYQIERISGPSQIAASEVIGVDVVCGNNQSTVTGTDTVATISTINLNTHSMVSGNVIILPAPGVYQISANNVYLANATNSRQIKVQVSTNGGGSWADFIGQQNPGASGSPTSISGSRIRNCLAGDQIRVVIAQNSGGNLSTINDAASNFLSVHRIGGVM